TGAAHRPNWQDCACNPHVQAFEGNNRPPITGDRSSDSRAYALPASHGRAVQSDDLLKGQVMSRLVEISPDEYSPTAFAKFDPAGGFSLDNARAMMWMSQLAYEAYRPGP